MPRPAPRVDPATKATRPRRGLSFMGGFLDFEGAGCHEARTGCGRCFVDPTGRRTRPAGRKWRTAIHLEAHPKSPGTHRREMQVARRWQTRLDMFSDGSKPRHARMELRHADVAAGRLQLSLHTS